jgi:PAS domain S-box-containing protein
MTQKLQNPKDKPNPHNANLTPEAEIKIIKEKPDNFAETEFERLLAAEREQRLLAEMLTEITLALTAQTSPIAVLEEILRQVQQIVPYQKASIRLLNENALRIAHRQGELAFDTQSTANQDQPLSAYPVDAEIVQTRRTRIINDTQLEPLWVSLPETSWIRSHIAAPICLGEQVLGLLRLDADTPGRFSARDAERLKPLVNAAAIALENARLHDQSRQEIADRKKAEEELAAERNLLRTLIDNVPDFIYVKDTESRFLLGSKAITQAVGLSSPDELVGKTDFDFLDQDLAKQYYADEQAVIRSGEPIIGRKELFIAPSSQQPAWYSTTTVPLRNNQGAVVGIIGLSHDITELKQSEQAILKSQTRLKLLNSLSIRITAGLSVDQVIQHTLNQVADYFPQLRVAYSTIDEQGKLTIVHSIEPPNMPHLSGVITDLTPASNYLKDLQQHKRIIIEDVTTDYRLAPLNGEFSAAGTRAILDVPLHHLNNLIGVICFDAPVPRQWNEHEITTLTEVAEYLSIAFQNIHQHQERERAEAELRASEELFRLVVNSISDHIYVWRVNESGAQTNLYLSHHAEILTGYPMKNFMNDWRFWPATVIHPEDQAAAAAQAEQLALGQHSQVEYRLIRADGQIIWVRDSARVEPENSSSKIVYGLVSDITGRKQAELEREWLTTELRNINQTLDERVRTRTAELQAIFDAVGEGILVTNLNGLIGYINPALEKLTGYSKDETVGQTPRLWKSERQNASFYT